MNSFQRLDTWGHYIPGNNTRGAMTDHLREQISGPAPLRPNEETLHSFSSF